MASRETIDRRERRKRAKAQKAEQRRQERLGRVPQQAEIDRRDAERWRADRERVEDETYSRLSPDDRNHRPRSADPLTTGVARVTGKTAKAVRRRNATTRFEWDQDDDRPSNRKDR